MLERWNRDSIRAASPRDLSLPDIPVRSRANPRLLKSGDRNVVWIFAEAILWKSGIFISPTRRPLMRCPAAISDGSRPNQIHAIPPQDRVTSRTSQPRGLYLRSDTSRTRSRFTHPIQGSSISAVVPWTRAPANRSDDSSGTTGGSRPGSHHDSRRPSIVHSPRR